MATDKRFTFSNTPPPHKDYEASITIPLPTTSANQPTIIITTSSSHTSNYNHHISSDVNNSNTARENIIHEDSIRNCHHQAATRNISRQAAAEQASRNTRVRSSNTTSDNNTSSPTEEATTDIVTTISTDISDDQQAPTPPPLYHEIPGIVPAYQGRTSGPPPSYDDVVNPNALPPSYHSLFGQVREARKTSNGLVDLFRQLLLILIGTLGCTMIIGFLLLIPVTMILVGVIYVNECKAENIPLFLVIGGLVWIVKNILNCYNQFKKDTTSNRPPPRRAPLNSSSSSSSRRTSSLNSTNVSINANNNHQVSTMTATSAGDNVMNISSTSSSSSSSQTDSTFNDTTVVIPRTTRVVTNSRDQNTPIRQPSLIGITSFKCESMLNYFLIVWFLAGCIMVYRIYEPDYVNHLSLNYCNRSVYLYAFWLMTSAFVVMAIVLSCLCCLLASSLFSCNGR